MGRRVRSAPLETRTARQRLAVRPDPYFVNLGDGLHLGYRRRASGGSEVSRKRSDSGKYHEERIGLADDFRDAKKVTPPKHTGKARKDLLMIRAREVAQSGGCTSWKHVFEVVERENPNDRALRIWATPADKFELDHLCEKARFKPREERAGRGGKPKPRQPKR